MGARIRGRNLNPITGSRLALYNPSLVAQVDGASGHVGHETCDDTTMPWPFTDDHNLSIVKSVADPPLIIKGEGTWFGDWRVKAEDYTPSNRGLYTHCPSVKPGESIASLTTRAIANLNPSKPTVDVPVFIFEFKDFPRMLRQLGDVLNRVAKPSDVAGGYLAYSFGWAPLIGDLGKLINLSKLINDRLRHLEKLEKGGKFKRSLGSQDFSDGNVGPYAIHYVLDKPIFSAEMWHSEKHRYWFTARGTLDMPLPKGFDERKWLAARLALGLHGLSAHALWEAIPWSWLIDYFHAIGNLLAATRGRIPWHCSHMCIMREKVVKNQLRNQNTNYAFTHNGGGVMTTTAKLRTVVANPTPVPALRAALTGHQEGILASLVTAGALRRFAR